MKLSTITKICFEITELFVAVCEPVQEASQTENSIKWIKVINEFESSEENKI